MCPGSSYPEDSSIIFYKYVCTEKALFLLWLHLIPICRIELFTQHLHCEWYGGHRSRSSPSWLKVRVHTYSYSFKIKQQDVWLKVCLTLPRSINRMFWFRTWFLSVLRWKEVITLCLLVLCIRELFCLSALWLGRTWTLNNKRGWSQD